MKGATIANYVRAKDFINDPDTGKVCGVICEDKLTGETFTVYTKEIIFAAGPYTDSLREMSEKVDSKNEGWKK